MIAVDDVFLLLASWNGFPRHQNEDEQGETFETKRPFENGAIILLHISASIKEKHFISLFSS